MYARLRCGGNLPLCLAFGTGEGYLWYGICVPCSNRLLWYATHFRRHSVRKTAFYGTEGIFGTGNALLRYGMHLQRPAEQPTPQTVDSLLPTGRIFSARNAPARM